MAKLRTSVRVVANAIRANGSPQGFGTFHDSFTGARCAIGQAAKNLKVEPNALSVALGSIRSASGRSLSDAIVDMNDTARWPLDKIADRIERDWEPYLDERVEV